MPRQLITGAIVAAAAGGCARGFGIQAVAPVAGEGCVSVRWPRDGRQLSYAGEHDLPLRVLELDHRVDTPLQPTFLTAGFHSWSPDGGSIVYAPGRGVFR